MGTPEPWPESPCCHAAAWAHRGAADHSGRENRQGPPRPGGTSKAPCAKTLGPTLPLPSALTLAHPSACHTALRFNLPASWGQTLKLRRPTSGPTQGAWPQSTGDLLPPRPERQTHPTASPPPGHISGPPIIQSGRMGRALQARGDIQRSCIINPLDPSSPSSAPSPRPAPPSPLSPWLWPAGLLRANPNPRLAPEGPVPRGLVLQCWGLGNTKPQRQTHPLSRPPPGPTGCAQSFRAGEGAGPSEPPASSKTRCAKTLGPMLPLPSAFTSSCPSARHTAL